MRGVSHNYVLSTRECFRAFFIIRFNLTFSYSGGFCGIKLSYLGFTLTFQTITVLMFFVGINLFCYNNFEHSRPNFNFWEGLSIVSYIRFKIFVPVVFHWTLLAILGL